jgi:hypothetical protein
VRKDRLDPACIEINRLNVTGSCLQRRFRGDQHVRRGGGAHAAIVANKASSIEPHSGPVRASARVGRHGFSAVGCNTGEAAAKQFDDKHVAIWQHDRTFRECQAICNDP